MTILERKLQQTTSKLVDHIEKPTGAGADKKSTPQCARIPFSLSGLKENVNLCLKAAERKHAISAQRKGIWALQ